MRQENLTVEKANELIRNSTLSQAGILYDLIQKQNRSGYITQEQAVAARYLNENGLIEKIGKIYIKGSKKTQWQVHEAVTAYENRKLLKDILGIRPL
jgi:hypothetical protein